MSKKRQDQRLDTIAFHSASTEIEATFTAAARDVFGELQVQRLEANARSAGVRSRPRAPRHRASGDGAERRDAARAARSGHQPRPRCW